MRKSGREIVVPSGNVIGAVVVGVKRYRDSLGGLLLRLGDERVAEVEIYYDATAYLELIDSEDLGRWLGDEDENPTATHLQQQWKADALQERIAAEEEEGEAEQEERRG